MSVLHRWHIDEREYERHEARRGRRHAFERIDAPTTALVVIDMVPFFCEENPHARGIVSNVNRLAGALRAAGGTVSWVVPAAVEPDAARVEFLGPQVAERYRRSGGAGPVLDRLWPELEATPGDLAFEKTTASAFFPGGCELDGRLRGHGIDTVLVTGTVANVCCESTVRDACTLGYRTVMVADANAAGTDDQINATLHTVYRSFGDVRTTDELIGIMTSVPSDPRPRRTSDG